MTDDVRQVLELRESMLLDIDGAGRLLVATNETGSFQLSEVDGDVPRALTALGEPVTGRYLPDRRTVVVSLDPAGSERTQLYLLDPDRSGPASSLADLDPFVVDPRYIHTVLDVAADEVLYATNRRNGVDFDVVSRRISTGDEVVRYDAGGSFTEVAGSPDGRWLAAARMTLLPASTQLLLMDLVAGTVRPITDPAVPGYWSAVHFTADSTALLASSDADAEYPSIRRFDLGAGSWETVLADPAATLLSLPAPDGAALAVIRTEDGTDTLHRYRVTPDGLADPTELPLPDVGTAAFRAEPVFSPDGGTLGWTFSTHGRPPEVFTWSAAAGVRQRTWSNPAESLPAATDCRSLRVPTPDGESIPVYVIEPAEAAEITVVQIHGGPEAATVRSWNPLTAALVAAGFRVVLPNVRGSAGYGRRWLSMDDVGLRGDAIADLAAVHAWLPTIGADPGRAALWGGSYGGYMVLAGLTFQPELWAAGVDIVGISSLVTFLQNTSAYRRAYREREYGRLDTDLAVLEELSPLGRIDELRSALFVIHGANDPRVPLSEAQQIAAAVTAKGVPCELLVYPDEGHGLAKRANRLDAYPKAIAFLRAHVGGAGADVSGAKTAG